MVLTTPVALDHGAGECCDVGEEVPLEWTRRGLRDELVLTFDSFTLTAVGKNKRLSKGYIALLQSSSCR